MQKFPLALLLVFIFLNGLSQQPNKAHVAVQTLPVSYRPTFHFTPKQNWMSDTTGLVYYKGEYHMFFQCNPFGNEWGHISWAHATSKDLMRWNEQPTTIIEGIYKDTSSNMVISGSAVVDSFNTTGFGNTNLAPLIAVYTTSHIKNDSVLNQYQSLAYSLNGNDFFKYQLNKVLDIGSNGFRNPKVFWYQPDHKWVMLVAKANEYKLQFYSSPNLKSWTFMSEFAGIGNKDKAWESPDIFELPVKNSNEKKWVITLSAGHPQKGFTAMQYFVGSFNGQSFTADPSTYPLYLDEGKDFYAGITFNNLPATNNRRIMIGWANCWEYAKQIPTKGFKGTMAIPRELSLIKLGDGQYRLLQQPVSEVNNYRGDVLFSKENLLVGDAVNSANYTRGDAMDIEFTIVKGDAAKAGIKVFKNNDEETLIYFDKTDNAIKLDRTRSGNVSFSDRFASVESVAAPGNNNDLKCRILIDKSIVEVFINDGEQALTDRVFPTSNNGGIEFFSTNGKTTFKNIKIWKMNAAMK